MADHEDPPLYVSARDGCDHDHVGPAAARESRWVDEKILFCPPCDEFHWFTRRDI